METSSLNNALAEHVGLQFWLMHPMNIAMNSCLE